MRNEASSSKDGTKWKAVGLYIAALPVGLDYSRSKQGYQYRACPIGLVLR